MGIQAAEVKHLVLLSKLAYFLTVSYKGKQILKEITVTKKITTCLVASLLLFAPVVLADTATPAVEVTVGTPAIAIVPAEAVAPVAPVEETPADAAVIADVEKDPGAYVEKLVQAFNAKDWGIFAGLAIMLSLWILKKFIWKSLPVGALPWVSSGTGVVVAVASGLFVGLIWWKAILNGLTVGAAASGLWSMVGKRVFGANETQEDKEEEKTPA